MELDIVIEAYNKYISQRRKELKIGDIVRLSYSLKREHLNDTTDAMSFAVFYDHPDFQKPLVYQNVMYDNNEMGETSAVVKCLVRWIDFFSENEDRIIEGNIWI